MDANDGWDSGHNFQRLRLNWRLCINCQRWCHEISAERSLIFAAFPHGAIHTTSYHLNFGHSRWHLCAAKKKLGSSSGRLHSCILHLMASGSSSHHIHSSIEKRVRIMATFSCCA